MTCLTHLEMGLTVERGKSGVTSGMRPCRYEWVSTPPVPNPEPS